MMNTEKLYYQNAFLKEFDAVVLSCEETGKNYNVILDRTVFYPEGGGQPSDIGTLGNAHVIDVQEKDGVICHTCDTALSIGQTVHGVIDWEKRFDHMQQHSGEHIVSGMLCSTYHCDNVGFHMGNDTVTIDYNTEIPWEGILEIEARANRYIWENHPFVEQWPSPEELKTLPYRSKKELTGPVRITSFPGADMCACCGTHVAMSGQVGLVKFLSCQKFRNGVRIELLCGKRAMEHYLLNYEQNLQIAQELSVKTPDTYAAVCRLEKELSDLKTKMAEMETASFRKTAQENAGKGDILLIQDEMSSDATRRLCSAVSDTCGGYCAVFSGSDNTYKYTVIYPEHDIRDAIKEMNKSLNGRGGGRDGMAQGSVASTETAIRVYFSDRSKFHA